MACSNMTNIVSNVNCRVLSGEDRAATNDAFNCEFVFETATGLFVRSTERNDFFFACCLVKSSPYVNHSFSYLPSS